MASTVLERLAALDPAPADALSVEETRIRERVLQRVLDADAESVGVRPAPPRRRRARWIGLGALLAGGVAVTLVMTDVVGLTGWRGGAAPAAADTLVQAAAAAITATDPAVAPGQYREITTRIVGLSSTGRGDGTDLYLSGTTERLYVPYDLDDDWVWVRPLDRPIRGLTPEADRIAREDYAERLREHPNGDGTLRARAGSFYGGSPAAISPASLAALPDDPYLLLNHIYRVTIGQGPSPDEEAFVFIADRLRSGIATARERAVFYRTLALIPGVTITDHRATLDGATGVAIGRSGTYERSELIVDPGTGALIGERGVQVRTHGGIPAGTVIFSSSITTRIVDSAPKGGATCPEGMKIVDHECHL